MDKKIVRKLETKDGDQDIFLISCPGCKESHQVWVPRWSFNFNMEKPTFSPSLLVRWPANPRASEEFKEWRTERICHSFITDGKIQFLDDCTHDLKGQTVELEAF